MVDFVVDKGLDVLRDQLDEHAPNRSKASDGSIGDADHQSRPSAHNPQATADSADGNDPDDQVDARDFTHDPANGADMNEMTEDIRVSQDVRVELVIWNRRQFSSYSTPTRKAWEWGPYNGDNPHDKHAHVQVRDVGNDNTKPWKVFMSLTPAQDKAIKSTEWRVWYVSQLQESGKNPANGVTETYPLVKLIKDLAMDVKHLQVQVADLQNRPPIVASPVDPATLQPVVEDGVRAVLRDGVV